MQRNAFEWRCTWFDLTEIVFCSFVWFGCAKELFFGKIWDADKRPGSFQQLKDTNKQNSAGSG